MNSKKRVVFRADSNDQIATGHVFRLLALAEVLKVDYEILFCIQLTNEYILRTIKLQVDQLIILPASFDYSSPHINDSHSEIAFDLEDIIIEKDIVVADGYWFKESFQLSVKKKGAKLVMIHDFAYSDYYADVVINHAPFMKQGCEKKFDGTKFYYGLEYALLRNCFYDVSRRFKSITECNKVFICFGGGNHNTIIEKVVEALENFGMINEIYIVTSSFQQFKSLKKTICYSNLTSLEISELMWECQLSICPSSTISIESFFSKMFLMIGLTAKNQENIHNGLVEYENVRSIGDWNKATVEIITKELRLAFDCWNRANDVFNYSFDKKNLVNIIKKL